jgi:hypothetical protein
MSLTRSFGSGLPMMFALAIVKSRRVARCGHNREGRNTQRVKRLPCHTISKIAHAAGGLLTTLKHPKRATNVIKRL